MPALDYTLDRTIVIRAPRATVFSFFTDSTRFARWWGEGSHIDPRPGGSLYIRYPNGVIASGTVESLEPERRVVFSYGFESGTPFPPGGSRVTISLADHADGTALTLCHELPDAASRDSHVQGWRYQLAVFSTVAAEVQFAGVGDLIDTYFRVWSEADGAARRSELGRIAIEAFTLRDRFSTTAGLDDLDAHLAAFRVHMPGVTIRRAGDVRHCQGTVLADWVAEASDGSLKARGTNVFGLTADGRLASVVGFWGAA